MAAGRDLDETAETRAQARITGKLRSSGGLLANLRLYIDRQAASPAHYLFEQALLSLVGWVPTVVGVALRACLYRLILDMDGVAAIENGVRLRFANHIRLGSGTYVDQGVYMHACPNGIEIGEGTFIMHHAVLHVYNFRDLPNAGISIGRNCLISEFNVLRGQGGITVGDNVYTAPLVQMLAVNHVHRDPTRPIVEQGITAQGIAIEDDAWIGAGAVILDGVCVGKGSVVGAGAVVVDDVPPHAVVAGVPARLVKRIDGQAPLDRRDVYL